MSLQEGLYGSLHRETLEMTYLGFKKGKSKSNISLYNSSVKGKGKGRYYTNVIDKDPKKMAQIFIDLWLEGYPVDQAFKIMKERLRRKDWLGL